MEISKTRNSSIDLLKFISMLGIVMIHVINQGGIIYNITNKFNFFAISLIYILVYSSVNIFAIISGYLYIQKDDVKYKNILSLIISMLFYSFVIMLIFYGFNLFNVRSEGIHRFVYSIFPPFAGRYWYITCYILLFCMIPYINKLIKNFTQKEFKKFILILFVLLSLISTFGFYDYFRINGGYSPFWLMFCYFIGAYFRLYLINNIKYNLKILLLSIFFVTEILYFLMYSYISSRVGSYLIAYNSPFILFISIIIFLIFCNKKISNNKLINYLSKTSFGVYLIHGNMLIYDFILKNRFMFLLNKNILLIICGIIIISLSIYFICSIIEYIRIKLFNFLKIDKVIELLGNKVDLYLKEK